MMNRGVLVLWLTCALFAASCKKAPDGEIIPPETAPLARAVIGYGVVNANYTHVLDKQGDGGKSLGFLRKGAIVEVLERRPLILGDVTEDWVLAQGSYRGWLKENELKMYDTEAKAKTAQADAVLK